MNHPEYPAGYSTASQTAPRQRTAIACKYCRRRKVRHFLSRCCQPMLTESPR
ncbi:hypothetical protein P152DRAFT_458514 [Eremomyces bilateralis CBS 781.70]|uniref:Uncharacterized protein n=1 Tax=Eremomyces bilateralis CBS 781.70 TaxID=1392243 RepID=A0A6G1G3V6_9PEZI|nr:uncharacterized protein P152DRAFT_458514 [Eremomyces bilateralis CBS 781.70]KAF1812698.1 hypothetical protein P152DRAFT_458514 [Eremomyces bilateralis CBS 781.70]